MNGLFTDLYELTMMCAYLSSGKRQTAVFELFVRQLPKNRNYLIFAGLEDIVNFVQSVSFSKEEIDYLHSLSIFPDWFLDYLKSFKFSGDIWAMPEGTPFFPHEPVLRVEAPIFEAQLIETAVMNLAHVSTVIASKAARVFSVSRGKILSDFSLRRTHGKDAGLKVARSCYIAGFSSTSNVLAGKLFNIPVVGTVAHSFIMAFDDEREAFKAYLETFPSNAILLIDTYDTLRGLNRAIEVAKQMGITLKAVRIDSGDVVYLSKLARETLDREGFKDTKIILSGALDEYEIDKVLRRGAPIDIFGVGTKVGTSADSPYVDFVYKLVEFDKKPVMKTSKGKKMYPGKKQVFRLNGYDLVGLWDESFENPLLEKVVEGGRLVKKLPTLPEIRDRFLHEFEKLPDDVKNIWDSVRYEVKISEKLEKLHDKLYRELLS